MRGDTMPETRFAVVPILGVRDVTAAVAQLQTVFGFEAGPPGDAGTRLHRLDQAVMLRAVPASLPHGVIDHVALKALDPDAAGRAAVARGGVVDAQVTPDGPKEISAFWAAGVRYLFLRGPGGARIEFCARLPLPADLPDRLETTLLGHDHIGLCCRDIAASEAFYAGLGMQVALAATLNLPEGAVQVCFLQSGGVTVELYSPWAVRDGLLVLPPAGLWQGLRFEGMGTNDLRRGPDGERVELVA